MTCKRCGQEHSPKAWSLAVIITNGRNLTRTDYGEKTVCGLADLIDREPNDDPPAPTPAPRGQPRNTQFEDLYTDGLGHCFSDADTGL